jgi:lipopolysaccharide/colanic/teichoic acid biosynthesis glycosyltransferase
MLFRQTRIGLHGKPFTLYKLKTMRDPRPGENPMATDAVRLTRLGRFLRATSLDELPTLWNVIKGDMRLVGPRPLLPESLPFCSPNRCAATRSREARIAQRTSAPIQAGGTRRSESQQTCARYAGKKSVCKDPDNAL